MASTGRTHALFTGDGRLGNQMFEAAFLDGILRPGDRLCTTGMEEFLEGFVWERMEISNRRDTRAHQSAKRWYRRLGRMAVKLRLVGGVRQMKRVFDMEGRRQELHGDEIVRTGGLFPRLLYVDKGYFQNAQQAAHASFRLKEEHLRAARAFLEALPAGPRAFVHVRRGDYRHWTIFGRSPLLRPGYFARGIALIRAAAPQTQFILLSDEVDAVASEIGTSGLHVFRGANVYEDFGVMTLCDGGVVSNSTLSWWGGFFCRRTIPVVSPRGWLAAGLGFEYPPGITAPWMTPIEP
jgi:hypothetical protein